MAAAAAGAWNFLDILKIAAPALNKLADATDNRIFKGLAGAMTIASAAGSQGGSGGQASGADATPKTPATMPSNPPGQLPRPGVGPKSIKAAEESTHTGPRKGWNKQQAELLKVKPGGYTKPGLQKAYLDGLKLSGAKLDNKGQIVKQSGQPFKTEGWDRKAQLMGGRRTPDRLHKLRMLAIDKATSASDVKSPNVMNTQTPQTRDEAKVRQRKDDKIWSLTDHSGDELLKIYGSGGIGGW